MKSRTINRIDNGSHIGRKVLLALIVLTAVTVGITLAYRSLGEICKDRCILTDISEQVHIEAGKMVRAEVIAEHFGLKKGANLDDIDFQVRRKELLEKVPTLRMVTVRRILPDKVYITAEERTPIARLNLRGNRRVSGRVVDAEGMVFMCQRGTQMLPTIREAVAPGTQPGHMLTGSSAKALELITMSREAEFLTLGVLEVDASKPDYLTAVLSNYSKAKLCWNDREDLANRLKNLITAIRSQIGTNVKIWNATMADKIFADTQEKL